MDRTEWIVGANPKDGRGDSDFYPTPPEVTQALIDFLQIGKGACVWECACGKGDMANVLESNGYKVTKTDIKYGEDFLTMEMPEGVDFIITNPPFSLAEKFIRRAWELGKPFAFLLKSQYWHSSRRLALFNECTPAYVLPLTWRPDFTGKGNSLLDMIWCYFDPDAYFATPYYIPLRKPKKRYILGVNECE